MIDDLTVLGVVDVVDDRLGPVFLHPGGELPAVKASRAAVLKFDLMIDHALTAVLIVLLEFFFI